MEVIVIGAGATGLTAAYLLKRAGCEVTLLEAGATAGGLLSTFDVGNGSRLETFYHHFFTHDAEIGWLLRELGIDDRIVYRKSTMGIFRGGRLYAFDALRDLLRFRAVGPVARLRFGFSSARLAYRKGFSDAEDVRCLDWLRRSAGQEATQAIWHPMLRIKFGEAAGNVPLAWMAGRLRQRVLSRRKGVERLGYVEGSLQVLVDRFVERLSQLGVRLRFGAAATGLLCRKGEAVGVMTPRGPLRADRIVSTIPTPVLGRLVAPVDARYAGQLAKIEYLGAICTVLALRAPLSSIYWTNVADAGYDFGGVIEHTNLVPAEAYGGRNLVYLSRYVRYRDRLWSLPDDELVHRQMAQLSRLYGRRVDALLQRSWVFRGRFAAFLPEVGFHRLIPALQTPIPNLLMAGMCHVYPDERSVNNSVRVAAELVRALGMPDVADVVPRGSSLAGKYGHHHRHASRRAA